MFPQDEFKLTRQAVFALLVSAAFSQTANAAPAGTVVFAVGDVSATAADGKVRPLLKGTEIAVGDTIVTGGNGRAQVRFTDGAFSSFQPETRFRVDQYQYEGKTDGSEKGFFSLLKGALRTVTGAIGHVNKKSYQVATPTATIGIRGTEYLAREGNSLSVSVGEGQIEVCNAAGCLVVADGESAFVKDASTQPTFTQQKTEAPPAPPQEAKPEEFRVAENRDATGGLTLAPTLLSGPGYLGAAAGQVFFSYDWYSPFVVHSVFMQPGNAVFDGAGVLTSFSADGAEGFGGSVSATAGVISGGFNDGIIGWGRWDSGTGTTTIPYTCVFACEGSGPLKDVHYVVGQPTPAADMMALYNANMVGTYSLLGFTYPTALDGYGNRTVGTQPVTGSLTAYFGSGNLGVTLGVPIGGNNFSIDGYAYFNPTAVSGPNTAHPAAFIGYGSVSGMSYGYAEISGLFAGANASRAGLVYQFDTYYAANPIGTVSGAATFKQTSLTMGSPPQ
ncbi:MAG: FecR domain-containing protein [Burkholderiales bacterium]|nr:FecR domain-containing protein [Burkholderiales bacterium]